MPLISLRVKRFLLYLSIEINGANGEYFKRENCRSDKGFI